MSPLGCYIVPLFRHEPPGFNTLVINDSFNLLQLLMMRFAGHSLLPRYRSATMPPELHFALLTSLASLKFHDMTLLASRMRGWPDASRSRHEQFAAGREPTPESATPWRHFHLFQPPLTRHSASSMSREPPAFYKNSSPPRVRGNFIASRSMKLI